MSERFRIKTIRMESGERLPLMLRVNGTPDWHTTLYSLTMQRSRGLSQSTIENSLCAIKVLYLFLAMNSISLEERLKSQSFLSDSEVARLVDYCKLPTIINPRVSSDSSIKARKVTPFLSKEKIRLKSPQAMPSVSLAHAATRITGLIHMRYFKTVGSSGNYNYTIHNFEGLPVSLARKNFTGIYKHEDIPDFSEALEKYLHDIAVEEDFQIRLGKYRKEMFVRYLICGVIAAFMLSIFVLIPVILVSVLYVFFSPYPEKKLRAKDEQEKQSSLKMAEF